MTFLSNENKGLLWELIKDTGIFDQMMNRVSRDKLMEVFEELLLKNNNHLPIKEKNKQFLSEYIATLNQLKEPRIETHETKELMKRQRENLFEERLRLKQEEFRQFQPQKPSAINFLEKEQDVKFEPIDLTNIPYTNTINMNEVKEVKKKVSFHEYLKPIDLTKSIEPIKETKEEINEIKQLKEERKQFKEEIKQLKEETNEIKQLLMKIGSKLDI